MPSRRRTPFLTACWRNLVMVNYEVEPAILRPLVPKGTDLEIFHGACLVSVVGFMFDSTSLLGRIPVPLLKSFEEVNLRFYVRSRDRNRRGVVFIRELAPSRPVKWVAGGVFHENYRCVPMRHRITWNDACRPQQGGQFGYEWRHNGQWWRLAANTKWPLADLEAGSLAEFVVEHYFGYSMRRDGGTLEYAVEHPRWRVWQAESCSFEADVESLYGERFVRPLSSAPHSALIAEGSAVAVYRGARIA